MPVYTLVHESQVVKEEENTRVYSEEAMSLVEAAVELALQEGLLKDAKDVMDIKLKDAKENVKSKLIDVADRKIKQGEATGANRKVTKSEGKHVKEDKDAINEYNRLRKKIKWNGKEFVGGTPEERERYAQIASALNLQNKIQ